MKRRNAFLACILLTVLTLLLVAPSGQAAGYNKDAAIAYARKYAANYNPAYPAMAGGDCASFVSQCLLAGGLPMDSTWYYKSSNNFSKYWSYAYWLRYYLTTSCGYTCISSPSMSDIAAGDIIWSDGGEHVMIVTEVGNGYFKKCAHTDDDREWNKHTNSTWVTHVVKMGDSTPAETLEITNVSYPSTYKIDTVNGYYMKSGQIRSNSKITSVTIDIQTGSGASISGHPKTYTPNSYYFSVVAKDSDIKFSNITTPGWYVFTVSATDESGKTARACMLMEAVSSGSTVTSYGDYINNAHDYRVKAETGAYFATTAGEVKAAPLSGSSAATIRTLTVGEKLDTNAVITNRLGETWYRLTNGSFVYSSHVISVKDKVVAKMTAKYTAREAGEPNRYYVTAEGGTAPYTYQYALYKDGALYNQTAWLADDNYRVDYTEPGVYVMKVTVRDQTGKLSDPAESVATVVTAPVPVTASVTGKYAAREVGQPNRYYIVPGGGTAPYTYYFRLYRNGTVYHNSGWIAADNYRIDFTAPGTYTMTVKVQDAKGAKSDWVSCSQTVVKAAEPLTVTASGKYTDREVGQPNRYYAAAQGGTAPYAYYFRLYKGSTVCNNSGWIAADNYRIDFTEAGTYTMTVKVQDAKGAKSDWVSCSQTVVKAAAVSLTAKITGKYTDREVGQPNRYYATAQGGATPYTYYFRLYKDGAVYHNSGWITANNYRIDFTAPGAYTMTVKVQDGNGNKSDWVSCTRTVVKAAVSLTAKITGKYTDREVGQPNRYYATAQGGAAPYTYYFRLYKDGAVYHNSGWISADNYRIDFTEAGTCTMSVRVQDANGNKSDWVSGGKTVVK